LLESLERELERGAGIHDPAIRGLLSRIVREHVPQRLNAMLRYQLESPGMEVAGVHLKSFVIHTGGRCSINLSLIESRSRNLHWHPYDAIFCRLNPGTSRVHRYRLPDQLANEVVDLAARLEFVETLTFAAGSFLFKSADLDVLDFEASPDEPVVIARMHLPSKGPLEWTFDRETLSPIGGTGNDPAESQLISLIRAAAVFPGSDLESLRRAVGHPSHSVRWAAVQAIGKLDSDAAVELLPGLARDPHPHIRRAAERTLASLEA
jgi:hypothetical protein